MMNDLNDLLDLRKKIEQAEREKERMEGRLQQLKDELKREFGAKSLKDAQAKLEKLEQALAEEEEEFREQVSELEELYNDTNGS